MFSHSLADFLSPPKVQLTSYSLRPVFIVISYFVSASGCLTALELLHRRTSTGGRYNWFLLAGAAIVMGGVSIWSMHFIGMQAIQMGDGQAFHQFQYNTSRTIASFFLPIVFVGLAFFVLSVSEVVTAWRILTGGLICGAAVCGMHYLGQESILNYQNHFDWRYVLASVIIAVVAASVALGVFFRLKSAWTNAIPRRVVCALGLATAVSLMHWTAVLGTSYEWLGDHHDDPQFSRATAVWLCGVLSFFCCITLTTFALIWQRVRRRYANRAQQIVIALATWDSDGRILLNSAGLLPCEKITKSYMGRSFKDAFTTSHPVFSWAFRVSRNWQSVAELIPAMRWHIHLKSLPETQDTTDQHLLDEMQDYAMTFKELFCAAAQDLANTVQAPLDAIGVLYDKIVDTGTVLPKLRSWERNSSVTSIGADTEAGGGGRNSMTLGRGQLLFIVRHVNKTEAQTLQSVGFNFAPVTSVINGLAQSLQISTKELSPYFKDLRSYSTKSRVMDPGVHLAFFALRPAISSGFDIMARKDARNLLPSTLMDIPKLEGWQLDLLAGYNDWESEKLLEHWKLPATRNVLSHSEQYFLAQVADSMRRLSIGLGGELFRRSRLVAKPFTGPCLNKTDIRAQATVIVFRVITDIHWSQAPNGPDESDEFVPSRLFMTYQHVYSLSHDHTAFTGRVHQEFAPMLGRWPGPLYGSPYGVKRFSFGRNSFGRANFPKVASYAIRRSSRACSVDAKDNSDDTISEKRAARSSSTVSKFGGVHVSEEVRIDVSEADDSETRTQSLGFEMSDFGPRTEISTERDEYSMIDDLMQLTLGHYL